VIDATLYDDVVEMPTLSRRDDSRRCPQASARPAAHRDPGFRTAPADDAVAGDAAGERDSRTALAGKSESDLVAT
jgi:hypothetical protein